MYVYLPLASHSLFGFMGDCYTYIDDALFYNLTTHLNAAYKLIHVLASGVKQINA